MLQEWLKAGENVTSKVAVESLPDLLTGLGIKAVPYGVIFHAKKEITADYLKSVCDYNKNMWNKELPLIRRASEKWKNEKTANFVEYVFSRNISMLANNMGVLLEDAGMPQEAFDFYTIALKYNPENISALLNIALFMNKAGEGFSDRIDDETKMRIADIEKNARFRFDAWSLSRTHGYVKYPEEYLKRGWIWVLSGQPGLAVSGMKKAIETSSEEMREPVAEMIAGLMLLRQRDDASAEIYEKMLKDNPHNAKALLGMARIMLRKGDYNKADEYIKKAEESGISIKEIALERAVLLFVAGKMGEARIILQELLDMEPANVRAMGLLAEILLAQDDQIGLMECVNAIQRIERKSPLAYMLKGRLAWRQGDWTSAYKNFQEVLRLEPYNLPALEWILRLDVLQKRREYAKQHAKQMLNFKQDHFLANYIMGSISLAEGDLDAAEMFLRRSLQTRKDPVILNDLAWTLQKKDLLDEAEKSIREALEINPKLSTGWDTLGVILMKKGMLSEAEDAVNKSLAIYQGDPAVFLHLVQLLFRSGKIAEAKKTAEMLMQKRHHLSFEAQREFKEILNKLGISVD